MSDAKKNRATMAYTRRAFLQQTAAGVLAPAVLGLVPGLVSGRAYAQSEANIAPAWLELARQYGDPTSRFGRIGDPVTLTVGYQPYGTIHWTASLNKQAQLLEKYLPKGSKVIWFRSLSGPLISNNMYSGRNQFGYMSDTPGLAISDKVPCDCVANSGYDQGEFGSICVPVSLLDSGKVKEPKDLEGKPVATAFGSFSHRQMLTWMDEYGVKVRLLNQSIDQQMSSLRKGSVYAAALWEPYPSWLEQQGVARRWMTGQDMPNTSKKYYPELDAPHFFDTGSTLAIHDWLRDRPDIIAAYLKSEEECRDMLTNAPDLAAYYIWTDISEVPLPIVRATIDMVVWDGRMDAKMLQHFKACSRQWKQEGFLRGERSKDPDAYVDNWANPGYLNLAMDEMQAQGQWTSRQLPGFPQPARPEQAKRQSWERFKDFDKTDLQAWQPTKI